MSSTSIFDTVKNFEQQFKQHQPYGMIAGFQGKKNAFKKNTVANERVKEIYNKAQQSIESWVEKPESWTGGIKNGVRNFLHKSPTCTDEELSKAKLYQKPFKWLGKQIHQLGDKITPASKKQSADKPYQFGELDKDEMARLKSKANLIKTVAKTLLVAGVILVGVGLLVPLTLGTLFFTLPETVILGTIIACSVLGVAGVAAAVAYPIIKNSKPVNEYEAETNKDFQRFVNEVVQTKDGGFNLSRKDIRNGEILKIFQQWKDSLESLFTKKRLKELEKERESVKK